MNCDLCKTQKASKSETSKRSSKILANSPEKKKRGDPQEFSACCLRLTNKEDIKKFSMQMLDRELQERAPLMRAALMAMSRRRSKGREDLFFMPAVGMAAAVCLKNRSNYMTAVQLILSLMMQHSGFSVNRYISNLFNLDFRRHLHP